MRIPFPSALRALPFALVIALAGCSGKMSGDGAPEMTKITGSVKRGGSPLVPPKDGRLVVKFVNASDPAVNYPADVPEQGGQYTLTGVPPGKYKVAVEVLNRNGTDTLGGLFSVERTSVQKEVSSDKEQTIHIDLPR